MKKIFALILALCLLCGATAFATEITENWGEGTTTVTLTIKEPEPCYDYIVTIPSAMTIGENGTGSMVIELDASDYTATDKEIMIGLVPYSTINDFKLKKTDDVTATIDYKLSTADNGVLGSGQAFLTYTPGEDSEKIKSEELTATVDAAQFAAAVPGTYEDDITFNVYLNGLQET